MKKRIIGSILTAAFMVTSLGGCSKPEETVSTSGNSDETTIEDDETAEDDEEDNTADALSAADAFASAAAAGDLDAMAEVCDAYFMNVYYEWVGLINMNDDTNHLTQERSEVIAAVFDTISYEIDEDSVENRGGDIFVDVTFTIADWDRAYDNIDPKTSVAFIAELQNVGTIELETSVCLREENGELVCCNYRRTLNMLYEFAQDNISWEHPQSEFLTGECCLMYGEVRDDGMTYYTNTVEIMALVVPDGEYEYGYTGVYCEVTRDGELIYTSYDSNTCVLYCGNVDPERARERGYLIPAGEYTFSFYTDDGTLIGSDTCIVEDPGPLPDIHIDWWSDNGDVYQAGSLYNVEDIYLTLSAGNMFVGGIDYTVEISYNGEVFYESSGDEDDQPKVLIRAGQDPYYPTDDTGTYFAEGEYTVTFYDANGVVIATDTRSFTVH